jgi:hypothetical protein
VALRATSFIAGRAIDVQPAGPVFLAAVPESGLSRPAAIRVAAVGDLPVSLRLASENADRFLIQAGSCGDGTVLAPGSDCQVVVRYQALDAAVVHARLVFGCGPGCSAAGAELVGSLQPPPVRPPACCGGDTNLNQVQWGFSLLGAGGSSRRAVARVSSTLRARVVATVKRGSRVVGRRRLAVRAGEQLITIGTRPSPPGAVLVVDVVARAGPRLSWREHDRIRAIVRA